MMVPQLEQDSEAQRLALTTLQIPTFVPSHEVLPSELLNSATGCYLANTMAISTLITILLQYINCVQVAILAGQMAIKCSHSLWVYKFFSWLVVG
jgi:hypothetical protein